MRQTLLAIAISVAFASAAFGHCDSLTGPVVTDARLALERRDVTAILKWVPQSAEGEVRDAFGKAVAARAASGVARDVADRWFFETVVRLHRAAEGEPYTGLQGDDYKAGAGIELADKAIEKGSLEEAEARVLNGIRAGLRQRFAEVVERKAHRNESVAAGRQYVHAYVEFIHYVEEHETLKK